MTPQNRVRDRVPGRPDADNRIGAGGHCAAVFEDRDRVYLAFMQAQNLLGDIVAKRPADRPHVKTPGQRRRAVGGYRKRADRSAMSAQLRVGWRATRCYRDQHSTPEQADHAEAHVWAVHHRVRFKGTGRIRPRANTNRRAPASSIDTP
jgi:hypothetical protein